MAESNFTETPGLVGGDQFVFGYNVTSEGMLNLTQFIMTEYTLTHRGRTLSLSTNGAGNLTLRARGVDDYAYDVTFRRQPTPAHGGSETWSMTCGGRIVDLLDNNPAETRRRAYLPMNTDGVVIDGHHHHA